MRTRAEPARGRHRALVIAKSKSEFILVGPSGPERARALPNVLLQGVRSRGRAEDFLERFLEGRRRPDDAIRDDLPSERVAWRGAERGGDPRRDREPREARRRAGCSRASSSRARPELVPVGVESGVPEQPIGWTEIVSGARNRARAAFDSGPCGLAVGIEDGLARLVEGPVDEVRPADGFFNVGCAWITDGPARPRLLVGLRLPRRRAAPRRPGPGADR